MVVCSLRVVACYSDYSSFHSPDCFDYSSSLGPGFGSDSYRCYLHTDFVVVTD